MIRSWLTLVLTLVLQAAMPGPADVFAAPSKGRIAGEALYRERVALTPAAVFEATLEELSGSGEPRVVARARKGRPGQVPISFTIRYDRRHVDRRREYQVRATVRERGRLRFEGIRAWSPAARGSGPVRVLMRMTARERERDRDGRDRDDVDRDRDRNRDRDDRGDRDPGDREREWERDLRALTGARWVPIEIGSRVVATRPGQREAWIELQRNTGRAAGSGGCNGFTSRYQAGRHHLRFDDIVSTRMACPELGVEQAFFDALRRTRDFRITGRTLELFDDRDRPLARLEERNPR